jgi:hypothetical protein
MQAANRYSKENTVTATLNIPRISTRDLTWFAKDKTFVTEASTIGAPGRIWADACDTGFILKSHATGRNIIVSLVGEARDSDGELQWETYQPTRLSDPSFTLIVFND